MPTEYVQDETPEPFDDELIQKLFLLLYHNLVYDQEGQWKRVERSVGRNDKCICGSGMKFKKCCIRPRILSSAWTAHQRLELVAKIIQEESE